MKKTLKILTVALLAITLIWGAVALGASAEERGAVPNLQITACTLSFDDSVYVMYALPIESAAGAKVEMLYFTEAQDSLDEYNYANAKYRESHIGVQNAMGKDSYVYKNKHLNAKNMTDVVYARAYAKVGDVEYYSNLVKYSILEYAFNTLGRIPESNPTANQVKLKELLETMLAYGAASQKYFNYNLGNLATDEYFKITVIGGHLDDMSAKGMFKKGVSVTLTANTTDKTHTVWTNSVGEIVHIGDSYTIDSVQSTETYTASSHNVVTSAYRAPTCTEDGLTEGSYCEVCGKVIIAQQVISATGHTALVDEAVAPTCTEMGLTEGSHCEVCGEVLREQTVVSALGHTEVTDSAIAPTCTETGLTEGSHCEVCGEILREQSVVDAHGHDEIYHSGQASTCTEDGWNAYVTCSRCDYSTYTVIPAAHNYVYRECTLCGDIQYSEGLRFALNSGGTYTVTGVGECGDRDIWIPDLYEGIEVTAIGYAAFSGCSFIESVRIPNSITTIEGGAFEACTSLTSISVAGNVYSIGYGAFYYCTSLIYATIGAAYIGEYAFGCCYALNEVVLGDSVRSIGAYAFAECPELSEIVIPRGVGYIGNRALDKCLSLDSVFYAGTKDEWGAVDLKSDNEVLLSGIYYYSECDPFDNDNNYWHYVGGRITLWEKHVHNTVTDLAVAPTCTETGLTEGSHCDVCGEVFVAQTVVDALGHDEINHSGQEPTCTEGGWYSYVTCSRCDYSTYEAREARGHNLVNHDAKDATCTEVGWEAYDACTRCDYSTYVERPLVSHKKWYTVETEYTNVYLEFENDPTSPFDVSEGRLLTSTNTASNTTSTFTITAKAKVTLNLEYMVSSEESYDKLVIKHNGKVRVTLSGTHITDFTDVSLYLNEGDVVTISYSKDGSVNQGDDCAYVRILTVPSYSYTVVEDKLLDLTGEVLAGELSCEREVMCDVCLGVAAEKLPHTEVVDSAKSPTCSQTGLTEGLHCEVCGEILVEQIVVSALGHDEIGHDGQEPTCTAGGWKAYETCSRCDYSTYESLDALGHTEVTDSAIAPTCTETGLTEGSHCEVCGEVLVEQTVVDVQHTYNSVVTAPTALEDGYTYYTCSVCGDFYTEVITPISFTVTANNRHRIGFTGSYSYAYTSFAIPAVFQEGDIWYRVTSIGAYAFESCHFTSVIIPNSVKSIGNSAFYSCFELETVNIPDSVTTIENGAFNNCTHLANITLPDHKLVIGGAAAFTFTSYYTNSMNWDGNVLYIGKHLIGVNGGLSGSYKVKEGTLTIADYAFSGCNYITSVTIPDSVVYIGREAFKDSGVTSVNIPEGVTSIETYTFAYCDKLTGIVIPKSVTTIGYKAFCSGGNLDIVYYGGTEAEWNAIPDGYGNDNLYSATIYYYSDTKPEKVGNYWHYVDGEIAVWENEYTEFTYALNSDGESYSVTGYIALANSNIIIPDVYNGLPVTGIEASAFQRKSITGVIIPDSVTSIGSYAFTDCEGLTSVVIGNGVKSIGFGAFSGCKSIKSIIIPDSVTSIANSVFYRCSGLTSVVIGDGLRFISYNAFKNCSALTSVVIGKSVTSIADNAFSGCNKLVDVTNLSSLNITAGSTAYGYVGYYATEIKN